MSNHIEQSIDQNLKWVRRSEQRPAEILQSALTLFVEKGYSATKIDDIAVKAGVSTGTIYRYFKNKEDIFRNLVQELMVPEVERAENSIENHTGCYSELLGNILQQWWERSNNTDMSGMPKLMITEAANFPHLASYYVENIIHRGLAVLANVISLGIKANEFKDCDPFLTARLVIAPAVYLAIWSHSLKPYDSKSIEPQEYIKQQIDLVLNGIRV